MIRVAPGVTITICEGTGTTTCRTYQAASALAPASAPASAPAPAPKTEAARLRREAQETVARQRAAEELERARARALAQERAQALLLEHLTPEQRASMEKNRWFVVKGGKTKRDYKIHLHNNAGNVRELDDKGKETAQLCCHCASDIPLGDQHLAQKLMLEYSEDEFLRVANRSAYG